MPEKSGKNSDNIHSGDAGNGDRLIDELKDRVAVLENELRSFREKTGPVDLIERKRAEEALRAGEEKYRSLIESTGDWVWETDQDFILTYDSPMGRKILGYEPDDVIGRTPFSLMPEDELERIKPLAWPAIAMHEPLQRIENRIIKKDGSIATIETTGIPLFDESGRYRGYRGINHDITERKRAEEAIKKSEEFLSNIFNCIQDGISILDRDLNIVRTNHVLEDWHSYMMPLVGKKCYYAYHSRDSPCSICPSIQAIKEKSMRSAIVPFSGETGQRGWLEIYAYPMIDEEGNVTGVVEHVRDISERKQAEAALKESEEKLRLVADFTYDWESWIGPDHNYIYVSPSCKRITGYDPGEFSRDPELMAKLVHPDDRVAYERHMGVHFAKTTGTSGSDSIDFRIVTVQGETRWINHVCQPVFGSDGSWLGRRASNRDITERKRAEEALQESEEKYRFLVENSRDLIWKIDLEGRWTFVGGNVERVMGYRADEIMGKTIWDFIAPECHGFIREKLLKRMRGEDIAPYTTWIINKAGDRVPLEVATTAIIDGDGKIVGVQGISRDITLRMRAEKEMIAAKSQAELYLDLMSHDINNMHQVALGYLELARDLPPGEEQTRLLNKPVEVLQRSAQLIQNVRKLQKLKEDVFQTRDVDVCGVLRDVQREFGAVPNKAITLNLNGCEECLVRSNELLHDVFTNLVSNAIKHTGDSADIIIDMDVLKDKDNKYCRVMVEDNGPGIPDDFKSVIFNRALRGTSKARGMGLGLYLVKSLVESYGGRVWVEDRIKGDHTKGARFVVLLPAID